MDLINCLKIFAVLDVWIFVSEKNFKNNYQLKKECCVGFFIIIKWSVYFASKSAKKPSNKSLCLILIYMAFTGSCLRFNLLNEIWIF